MKKKLFIVACVCLVGIFAVLHYGCAQPKSLPSGGNFTLKDLQGKSVTLSSFKDKHVLLFFWTTWCPYCRIELQSLQGYKDEMKKSGVEVLLLNEAEEAAYVSRYIKDHSITYTVLLDSRNEVAYKYGLVGVPTYILLNKAGKIVYSGNSFPATYKELIAK